MTGTKLIIVEGIPGSGKSTTANFIKDYYEGAGVEAKLFSEGDFDHPADFESVSCLDEAEYKEFALRHMKVTELLYRYSKHKGNEYFFKYMKMKNENEEYFMKSFLVILENLTFMMAYRYKRTRNSVWKDGRISLIMLKEAIVFVFLNVVLCKTQ